MVTFELKFKDLTLEDLTCVLIVEDVNFDAAYMKWLDMVVTMAVLAKVETMKFDYYGEAP